MVWDHSRRIVRSRTRGGNVGDINVVARGIALLFHRIHRLYHGLAIRPGIGVEFDLHQIGLKISQVNFNLEDMFSFLGFNFYLPKADGIPVLFHSLLPIHDSLA